MTSEREKMYRELGLKFYYCDGISMNIMRSELLAEIDRLRDENQWLCDSRNKLAGEAQSLTVERDQLRAEIGTTEDKEVWKEAFLEAKNKQYNLEKERDQLRAERDDLIAAASEDGDSWKKWFIKATERREKLAVAQDAFAEISGTCPHDDGDNGESCSCSTPMAFLARHALAKIRGEG